MAEEDNDENEENEEKPQKKSKKKLIIIIVAVLVLVVGGGAGAYFGGLIGGDKKHAKGQEEGKTGPVFVEIPQILVNLNTASKKVSFLKMSVSLEVQSELDAQKLEAMMPRIIDAINTYARELRAADLHGSAGTYRLREELLLRANKASEPVKISNILFKEILIQ